MLAQELRSKIDKLRDLFWSGGIANPMAVIEQISYLIFMKRLEDMDNAHRHAAERQDEKYASIFRGNEDCRWSAWINLPGEEMLAHVRDKVFPFIKNLKGEDTLYSRAMRDAVFIIPRPSLLQEAVKIIDDLDITAQNQDIQGDLYEYLLAQLNISGENGQFRTPRHIIRMIVELVDPKLGETICDPACGTCGFLVNAYQHILRENTSPEVIEYDEEGVPHHLAGDRIPKKARAFLKESSFFGYDFDSTMVRFGLMNMVLHGLDKANVRYADTLSKAYEEKELYDVVLANPPFKGNINKSDISSRLQVKTTKTELLFINLFLDLLVIGGRCGVIVPHGVLFGASKAHRAGREMLIDRNQLEGVISMPSGVFKPYAGVSTAVLVFTKGGTTDNVWFYDMQADGFSLDDKRNKVEENNIPEILEKWKKRDPKLLPEKGENWFWVPAKEIRENDYDLSVNRYKPIEYEEVEYDDPNMILDRLQRIENGITKDLSSLRTLL